MKQIYQGKALKTWFLAQTELKRFVLKANHQFHILDSMEDIKDDAYYFMIQSDGFETMIEEVELIASN